MPQRFAQATLPTALRALLAGVLAIALSIPATALTVIPAAQAAETAAPVSSYAHVASNTASTQFGDLTITVSWNDVVYNTPAVFHCEASGIDGMSFKYQMSAVSKYADSGNGYASIVDPSQLKFQMTPDFSFTFATPGKYRLKFQILENRTDPTITGYLANCLIDFDVVVSGESAPTVASRAEEVAAECKAKGFTTDYQKALWLHDWVIDHTEYSYLYSTAEGVFLRGQGSCEAYHEALAILLGKLGMESRRIGYGAPDMHAWTMAKLDGKWYHIDATWDDVDFANGGFTREEMRHLYFGVNDEIIGTAHVNHTAAVPGYECNSLEDNYFVKTGKAATLADAYKSDIQAQLKAGKTSFMLGAKNADRADNIKNAVNRIIAYDLVQRTWTDQNGNALSEVQVTYADDVFAFSGRASAGTPTPGVAPSVAYATHVQNVGWQGEARDGALGGTTGRSLRVEAYRVRLASQPYSGSIRVRSHVQNIGWQNWVYDGAESGTTGRSLRVEALQIELTGEMAQHYDVYYRTHVQNVGDTGWAKNGESCGSAGYGYRMEAVHITLLPKGSVAPGSIEGSFLHPRVTYQTHVQNIGWQRAFHDGETGGTTGLSLRVEAFRVSLCEQPYAGSVQVSSHVQNIGWQDWVSDGATSGTSGRSLRVEALKVRLTDEMAERYDIYYRAHCQNVGWTGWAKNGDPCGTAGYSYRMEGIQIELVPKGEAAPGSASSAFFQR